MYIYLELSQQEVRVLKIALNSQLNTLRYELARTDDRAYRSDLKQELSCLEGIDRQLEGSQSQVAS